MPRSCAWSSGGGSRRRCGAGAGAVAGAELAGAEGLGGSLLWFAGTAAAIAGGIALYAILVKPKVERRHRGLGSPTRRPPQVTYDVWFDDDGKPRIDRMNLSKAEARRLIAENKRHGYRAWLEPHTPL